MLAFQGAHDLSAVPSKERTGEKHVNCMLIVTRLLMRFAAMRFRSLAAGRCRCSGRWHRFIRPSLDQIFLHWNATLQIRYYFIDIAVARGIPEHNLDYEILDLTSQQLITDPVEDFVICRACERYCMWSGAAFSPPKARHKSTRVFLAFHQHAR